MIIFGWRSKRTVHGVLSVRDCPSCKQKSSWPLVQMTNWFTLFFIPVIPMSTKYYSMCSVCQAGYEINKRKAERMIPLAKGGKDLLDGKITKEEFEKIVTEYNENEALENPGKK